MGKHEGQVKTNAMRELDQAHIAYTVRVIEGEEDISRGLGLRMAEETGADPDSQFKTLVCISPTRDIVVCCIPVAQELDLKKAAAAAKEKSLELLPIGRLEAVTGYVRGGCTPVGMKKRYPTLIDETAQLYDAIGISGGKRGVGLALDPEALASFLDARFVDLVQEGR